MPKFRGKANIFLNGSSYIGQNRDSFKMIHSKQACKSFFVWICRQDTYRQTLGNNLLPRGWKFLVLPKQQICSKFLPLTFRGIDSFLANGRVRGHIEARKRLCTFCLSPLTKSQKNFLTTFFVGKSP